MKRLFAIALISLALAAPGVSQGQQRPVAIEIHSPLDLTVTRTADPGMVKYTIDRVGDAELWLTAILSDAAGHVLHRHTDRMGNHAEVAWASDAPVAKLVLIIEQKRRSRIWRIARWPVAAGMKAALLLTNTTSEGEDAAGTQKGQKKK